MAHIKTDEIHLEHLIEIKRWRFNALLVTPEAWLYLDGPSEIQWPRLNRNDSHLCVSSEPLIED